MLRHGEWCGERLVLPRCFTIVGNRGNRMTQIWPWRYCSHLYYANATTRRSFGRTRSPKDERGWKEKKKEKKNEGIRTGRPVGGRIDDDGRHFPWNSWRRLSAGFIIALTQRNRKLSTTPNALLRPNIRKPRGRCKMAPIVLESESHPRYSHVS